MLPNRGGALPVIDSGYLDADLFLMRRDIWKAVSETYDDKGFLNWLELTGNAEESDNSVFHHFERGSVYRRAKVNATPGGTAASGTIVLTASSHTTINGVNRSYPKVGDIVFNPKTGAHGRVTAKDTTTANAHVITVAQIVGGQSIITGFPSGDEFSAYSSAYAEGTGMPAETVDNPLTRFFAQMQNIKTKGPSITGTADSNKTEISFQGKPYYYYKAEADNLTLHRLKVAFSALLGPGGTTVDEAGKVVPLMTGLDTYVKTLGNVYPLATPGTYTFADMDAIVSIIEAERGGNEYIRMTGFTDKLAYDKFWRTQTNGGGIVYNSFGKGDGKQNAIDLGFSSVTYGDITFHSAKYDPFNHSEVTGLAGSPYPGIGIWIPADKQNITVNGQVRSVPSMMIRYKTDHTGKSRRLKSYSQGIEITNIDAFNWYQMSEEGLQMAMLNKFIRTS